MNFLELAKNRFSSRTYTSKPVSDEDLNYILEAGRVAPSANNCQPWLFLVIREPENLKQLQSLYHREWFRKAPVVILILVNHEQSWKRAEGKDHADTDAAIAIDHMTLAATDRGLGTCWVCNFDKEKTVKHFNLPEHLEPIAFLPIGYPDSHGNIKRHESQRKPLQDIVFYESLHK